MEPTDPNKCARQPEDVFIAKLLEGLGPKDLQEVINVAKGYLGAHEGTMKQDTSVLTSVNGPDKPKKAAAAKNKVSKTSSVTEPVTPEAELPITLRPLNSWIAFRSYYSQIFASQTQKNISGLMTTLWKEDPFHEKWSALAAAYSAIRDLKGKAQVPLSEFLKQLCPEIGIIAPSEYLSTLGWMAFKTDNGTTLSHMHKVDLLKLAPILRPCHYTAKDILSAAVDVGYLSGDDFMAVTYKVAGLNADGSKIPNIHAPSYTDRNPDSERWELDLQAKIVHKELDVYAKAAGEDMPFDSSIYGQFFTETGKLDYRYNQHNEFRPFDIGHFDFTDFDNANGFSKADVAAETCYLMDLDTDLTIAGDNEIDWSLHE